VAHVDRTQIVANIRRREPSFLCKEEWCTVPYEVEGKDYRHEILDVMVNIPRIQSEHDDLKANIVPDFGNSERRQAYFDLCASTRDGLEDWLKRLRTQFDVDRITLIEEGIPDNFPLANIMLAHSMTLYWASMILVNIAWLQGLRESAVTQNALGIDNEDWLRVPNFEITRYIMYIAKSIPFFFQPDAGSICPQTFSFSLGVALNIAAYTNAQQVPEYRRLLKAFSKGPMGAMIQKFLTSLQLLSAPNVGTAVDDEDDDNETTKVSYDKIRMNSEKYHDEGAFVQRPLNEAGS
jgi:hypothetical protein